MPKTGIIGIIWKKRWFWKCLTLLFMTFVQVEIKKIVKNCLKNSLKNCQKFINLWACIYSNDRNINFNFKNDYFLH